MDGLQDVEERKERGLERAVERYTAELPEQTVEISKGIPGYLATTRIGPKWSHWKAGVAGLQDCGVVTGFVDFG